MDARFGAHPQRLGDESSDMQHLQDMQDIQDSPHFAGEYDALAYEQYSRRVSSIDGSETATDDSSVSGTGNHLLGNTVSEQERLQIETFFRGLKTQVFVCGSLANLYTGCTAVEGWELEHTGVPVLILDSGETRARVKRRIQILLAERGTCFTLWRDTIDNLTAYRIAGQAFHTMHLSSDHTSLIGLSFDSVEAAEDMFHHVEMLTADPENISLSTAGKKTRKSRRMPAPVKLQPLPAKEHISQPCCFQHITSVGRGDRTRYLSLQTLVGSGNGNGTGTGNGKQMPLQLQPARAQGAALARM